MPSTNPIKNLIQSISPRDLRTCKNCGCPNLAWVQFKSTGKWALCGTATRRPFWQGESQAPEGLWIVKTAFHRCAEYKAAQEAKKVELAGYQAAIDDKALRATWCHPKADTPGEILADVVVALWMAHIDGQFDLEHFQACAALLAGPLKEVNPR